MCGIPNLDDICPIDCSPAIEGSLSAGRNKNTVCGSLIKTEVFGCSVRSPITTTVLKIHNEPIDSKNVGCDITESKFD